MNTRESWLFVFALRKGYQHQIPELHRTVIALQLNRPWPAFEWIEGDSGQAVNDRFFIKLLSIQRRSDLPSHQTDLVGLPLVRRFTCIYAGQNARIQRAGTMHVRRTAVIGGDLDFIAAAQANAAVALLPEPVFGVQYEIPILRNRDQIVRLTLALQNAVLNRPACRFVGVDACPSFEVLTVKQRYRFTLNPGAI